MSPSLFGSCPSYVVSSYSSLPLPSTFIVLHHPTMSTSTLSTMTKFLVAVTVISLSPPSLPLVLYFTQKDVFYCCKNNNNNS